jgi:hypothetical protein
MKDSDTFSATQVYCFGVVALPDPGALARIIEPFAKLGLVPLSVNSRHFIEAEELAIDLQIVGISEEQCSRIANQIGSMPLTLRVVTGRKYYQAALVTPSTAP